MTETKSGLGEFNRQRRHRSVCFKQSRPVLFEVPQDIGQHEILQEFIANNPLIVRDSEAPRGFKDCFIWKRLLCKYIALQMIDHAIVELQEDNVKLRNDEMLIVTRIGQHRFPIAAIKVVRRRWNPGT